MIVVAALATLRGGSMPAATAAVGAKLPPAEARQWIAALRAQKTGDGSTVAEVLASAQRMRPAEFKAGGLDIVSSGEPSKPVGVGVDVFIGQKRRADDAMTLSYGAVLEGRRAISFTADHPGDDSLDGALLLGRNAFLRAVDREYGGDCVDPDSGAKLC